MKAAALALLLALASAAALAGAPKPALKIENPGQCIAPTEEMRKNHMEMLKHQRDRTLRQGIRGEKASLNGCIECHASKATGSVLGKGGFCQECHAYAAVKLDCWDCHQPKAGFKHAGAVGVKP
ncbi:MAG: hypothetical protein N3C63_04830 [Rhodocyclaceae bacterium]|nr:hypothetical protein [Rhodocyclaceae bacterium]